MANSYGGSASASTDTDGKTEVEITGNISHTSDDGSSRTSVGVSASAEIGPDGNVSGGAKVEVKVEKEFNFLRA